MDKETVKLFITSWPHGRVRPVLVLDKSPYGPDKFYIQYLDGKGGTDTTTKDFLFDVPEGYAIVPEEPTDKMALHGEISAGVYGLLWESEGFSEGV